VFNHKVDVSSNFAVLSGGYLTPKEVAARLRVCRRTIEREIASGRFPRPLKVGRCSRFTESDLAGYEQKLREERDKVPSP
jgi:excisionase family DNA binding protein